MIGHFDKIPQFIHFDDVEIKDEMNDTMHCSHSNIFDPDANAINVKTSIISDDFRFFEIIAKNRHNRDKTKIVVAKKDLLFI